MRAAQVAIAQGLRHAACVGLRRDAAQEVTTRIDARADEVGMLAKTTVREIVPNKGQHLQATAHARLGPQADRPGGCSRRVGR